MNEQTNFQNYSYTQIEEEKNTSMKTLAIIAGIALIVFLGVLYFVFRSIFAPEPQVLSSQITPTPTEVLSTITATPSEMPTDTPTETPTPTDTEEPTSTPKPTKTPTPKPTRTTTPTPTSTPTSTPTTTPTVTPTITLTPTPKPPTTITHHISMKWAIQGYPTIFRKFAVTVPNNQRHDRVTINTYLTYADVSIYAKDKEKYNGILHYRWYRQPKQVQVNPMSFVTVGTLKNGSKLYRAIPISDRSQYVYFSQYYGGECKSIPIKPKPIITIEPPITVYPISPNQIKPPIPTPVPMLCAVSTILYGLDKSTTIDEVYLSSVKPESVKEYDKIVLSIIPEK